MTVTHKRNTRAMLASPRCGAKTRFGTFCRAPAVRGKRRCRMHGCGTGSGAPIGNQNALKHGRFTRAAIQDRRAVRKLIRDAEKLLDDIE